MNGQDLALTGIINTLEKSWELNTIIDDFKLSNNTFISGSVYLQSGHLLAHISGDLKLNN